MKCFSDLNILDHPSNIVSVIQKLPFYLQNKWREYVWKARHCGNSLVHFQDLVDFVSLASDEANDPIYGKAAWQRSSGSVTVGNKKPDHVFKKDKVASFATSVSLHESTVRKAGRQNSCQLCQHDHDLEECEAFLAKSVDDRRVFLKENRMCFGCFAHGHISKGCLHKRRCKTCAKLHPTALHVDSYKWRNEGRVADVTVHTTAVSQDRLPVATESTTSSTAIQRGLCRIPKNSSSQGTSERLGCMC